MTVYATIGAKALYLLFIWLISASGAAWLADRKGYGERLGLTFGLILTFVGFLIVLLLPGRPGSAWKVDGPLPRRARGPGGGRGGSGVAVAEGPPAVADGPPGVADGPPADGPDPPSAA
jgi:hypothetical protein